MTAHQKNMSIAAIVLAAAALAGCGDQIRSAQAQAPGGMPPPEVAVVTVAPERIALTNELPGRLEATRVAEVRARVAGIVTKRVFREGDEVKANDVLFRIDPAPFQAAANSAQAVLAKAEANLAQTTQKAQRYKPLVETNAISKQEYDDALTAQKQAAADVASAKAALDTARLNLGYATVNAPISGRIGRALVTEGALVGQGAATPLATIQQLDSLYVNITQPAAEALKLQRAMREGKLQKAGKDEAKVSIVTEDGTVYPHAGKLLFSDQTVDPGTGAITLRAVVPNPERFLLPGMYVRARVEQAVQENAITVPQQAVQRQADAAIVMVVGPDNKVAPRPVKAETAVGDKWVVSEGLKAGERIVVEGFQKAAPGAVVNAVPWKQAATPATTPTHQ
ncbi:efflux RND transporter periplasmic adaptor subunit [Noviherbaspirillum sp.]|uniref:efflux RND transporter periplasmic adaptor subunit n=1 Tax=Noviherbaspirillum sp. TaxID=1926288 RepID=UPI002D753276|nr:efflux RND transporter periplasmic adaptor subunit [Noviherbaspirillum sp.]HZW20733.1 efflux RND transporter periplasmic adaptor subunit [Noviherbaspirillum sp.]